MTSLLGWRCGGSHIDGAKADRRGVGREDYRGRAALVELAEVSPDLSHK